MTMAFSASRPGAWLRDDIADILTALAIGHNEPDYLCALMATGNALGLRVLETSETTSVTVEGNSSGIRSLVASTS